MIVEFATQSLTLILRPRIERGPKLLSSLLLGIPVVDDGDCVAGGEEELVLAHVVGEDVVRVVEGEHGGRGGGGAVQELHAGVGVELEQKQNGG